MKIYNRHNFHKHTFCIFTEVDAEKFQNAKPDYTSKSGSMYHFNENGVYRISNHWGRAANCKWRLKPLENSIKNSFRIGYANWKEFQSDNDTDKLYYIEMDTDAETVSYDHVNNSKGKLVFLRTASATAKRIKQIRHLMATDQWLKHLPAGDTVTAKKALLRNLILTDSSLHEIKRGLLP